MSEKLIARKSDKHDCPLHGEGEIIDGWDGQIVEGLPVARVGDRIQCPDGSIAIIEDNDCCMEAGGKKIARIGDKTSHGGTITTGASSVTAEDGDLFIFFGPGVEIGENVHFGNYVSPEVTEVASIEAAAIALEVLKEAAISVLLAAAGVGLSAAGLGAAAGVPMAAVGVARLGKAGQTLYKATKAGKAVDITTKRSKLNLQSNLTRAQLEKNLQKSGFTEKKIKTDGVSVFQKTDKKYGDFEYSVRDYSKSGAPTAEGSINGKTQFKLRLKK